MSGRGGRDGTGTKQKEVSFPVKSEAKEKRKGKVIGSFSLKTERCWESFSPMTSIFFF